MRKNIREAEEVGFKAFCDGTSRDKNPLTGQEASAWSRGWKRARLIAEQKSRTKFAK